MNSLVQLTILAPLLGALIAFVVGRRNGVAFACANAGTVIGLIAAGLLVAKEWAGRASVALSTVGSLPLGPQLRAPMELRVNATAVLLAAVALFVAVTVQMFARWYLYSDPRYRSFTATVALFTSAMMLVIFSNDVLLTLIGWEVMGWCSYLLIGHESSEASARRAAQKAFLVTRIADAPFVVGLGILATFAHTTRISDIPTAFVHDAHPTMLMVAMLFIICGVLGKSAQFPFSDWLPDAMAGPTPASALIHAATMVAAGTVILAQLNPLLIMDHTARMALVIFAGATSVGAAFSAFLQHDMKRLLAWSTISQVGLMLLAIGAVPPGESVDAALLHLVGHAFFKSLLFLMVGWLSVVVGSTLVTRISGSVRKLPLTFVPVLVGFFTMAGLPPTVAFVSKDIILEQAARGQAHHELTSTFGLVLLLLIVAGTAAYSARAWFILQYRTVLERRGEQQVLADSHTVREVGIVEMLRNSPQVDEFGDELESIVEDEESDVLPRPGMGVRFALWGLALGGMFGGALAFSPLFNAPTDHFSVALIGASLLIVIGTVMGVRVMSLHQLHGDAARRLPANLRLTASRGWGLDGAYQGLVVTPTMALARGVRRIEGFWDTGVMSLPLLMQSLGSATDRAHRRKPASGLAFVLSGVIVAAVLGVTLW